MFDYDIEDIRRQKEATENFQGWPDIASPSLPGDYRNHAWPTNRGEHSCKNPECITSTCGGLLQELLEAQESTHG